MARSAPTGARTFPRELLADDTESAARRLLGARLVRGSGPRALHGRIVELEAYDGEEDLASHARFGSTKRNAVMYGPPGVAYVYLVYGMYNCLNVVTSVEGKPAAALVRAVAVVTGADEMRAARLGDVAGSGARGDGASSERARKRLAALPAARLASGPGLVCAAFSIGRDSDGRDLCDPASDLRLEIWDDDEPLPVEAGPRVGIDYAAEPWRSRPWRFFVPGNASVSTVRSSHPRRGRA